MDTMNDLLASLGDVPEYVSPDEILDIDNQRFILDTKTSKGKQSRERLTIAEKNGRVQVDKKNLFKDNNGDYFIIDYSKGGIRVYGILVPYTKKNINKRQRGNNTDDAEQAARDNVKISQQNLARAQRLADRELSAQQKVISDASLKEAKANAKSAADDLASLLGTWELGENKKQKNSFGKRGYLALLRDLKILKSIR